MDNMGSRGCCPKSKISYVINVFTSNSWSTQWIDQLFVIIFKTKRLEDIVTSVVTKHTYE